MKWHPLLAFTLILANAAGVAAQDNPTYRGQASTFVAAGKRAPVAQRAPKAQPTHKKHASHSLFGSWNPFEGLAEIANDVHKHLPKKKKRCSGMSLIDLPDIDLSWMKLPELPKHSKAPAPKPTKAGKKRAGASWFNRPVYPWVTNGTNPEKPAVDPPKPVPAA
ncbi:MAG: hypothetical protein CMJ75_14125 [Planctomycetaceae bacterium]|nr:hypothetical protein [Planctomycetaceae bacterium]